MPFLDSLVTERLGPNHLVLLQSMRYQGSQGDILTVPAGTETDLASVPQVFTVLTPRFGKVDRCAVLHDQGCYQQEAAWRAGRKPPMSSRDVDGLFRLSLKEEGQGWTRWLYWLGVRLGCLASPYRRDWGGLLRDSPLLLALSVASLTTVLATVYALHLLVSLVLQVL